MAKSKSKTESALPPDWGFKQNGFSQFELIAIEAMSSMLSNPGILQLGLTPAEINDMVTTGSLQIATSMLGKFDQAKNC